MDRSPPHRRRWRGRVGATALSAGLHGTLLVVLLLGWRTVAPPTPQLEIPVSLGPAPAPLPPAPKPPAPQTSTPAKPAAAHAAPAKQPAAPPTPPTPVTIVARRSRAPPAPASPPARFASRAPRASLDQFVDAQLAANRDAAGGAGQGVGQGGGGLAAGGGGECDMAGRVQAALRKDPLARAAVRAAGSGRSILIWNGDWVQTGAEDGKGLAAVREAITWEVAFAPIACRRQRVRGPILLSLNDGSPEVELGAGEWRWSDLLGLR